MNTAWRITGCPTRDRERRGFVVRPGMNFASAAGHLLLASEIKAILASGLLRPSLDAASVDAYLGLYYVPPDRSIYTNVHPLPPAHAATWRAGGEPEHAPRRYWEPRYSCHDVDEAEAVKAVRSLVERAVCTHQGYPAAGGFCHKCGEAVVSCSHSRWSFDQWGGLCPDCNTLMIDLSEYAGLPGSR